MVGYSNWPKIPNECLQLTLPAAPTSLWATQLKLVLYEGDLQTTITRKGGANNVSKQQCPMGVAQGNVYL